MGRRNRATEFKGAAREIIKARDGGCIFCKMGYKMPPEGTETFGLSNFQIMHFVMIQVDMHLLHQDMNNN